VKQNILNENRNRNSKKLFHSVSKKGLTNFLFTGSLNPKSPMSFCGNSFASGRRHDNMLSAFNTGAGGVTSSEILPNRSQGLIINIVNASNSETRKIYRQPLA
jgi:hypothetical protein